MDWFCVRICYDWVSVLWKITDVQIHNINVSTWRGLKPINLFSLVKMMSFSHCSFCHLIQIGNYCEYLQNVRIILIFYSNFESIMIHFCILNRYNNISNFNFLLNWKSSILIKFLFHLSGIFITNKMWNENKRKVSFHSTMIFRDHETKNLFVIWRVKGGEIRLGTHKVQLRQHQLYTGLFTQVEF